MTHMIRRKQTLASCPLTFTCIMACICTHAPHTTNKRVNARKGNVKPTHGDAYAYNPSIQETEAGLEVVWGKLCCLHNETLSYKGKEDTHTQCLKNLLFLFLHQKQLSMQSKLNRLTYYVDQPQYRKKRYLLHFTFSSPILPSEIWATVVFGH